MLLVTPPFATRRAAVDGRRAEKLSQGMARHGHRIARLPDEQGPGEAPVSLSLSDDASLRG